jgi:hypothetical protein
MRQQKASPVAKLGSGSKSIMTTWDAPHASLRVRGTVRLLNDK